MYITKISKKNTNKRSAKKRGTSGDKTLSLPAVSDPGFRFSTDQATITPFQQGTGNGGGIKTEEPKNDGAVKASSSKVVAYARSKVGKKVGRGECYDLADLALRKAGAKSAPDFGKITRTANYVWGKEVALSIVMPGDVVQFKNYRFKITKDDGSWSEQSRPHHTAIIDSVEDDGALIILEQNAPQGSPVLKTKLYFKSGEINLGLEHVTVSGELKFYRAVPE